jgi:hypothetical protein
MRTGRITYQPEPASRRPAAYRALLAYCLAVAAAAVCAMLYMALTPPKPVATAIPSSPVIVFPLEPLDAQSFADARVEAFRAGYAQAAEEGCRTVAQLRHPIGDRP